MNSDDLIDQIISKGLEYDKNEITVDSVLKDLINTDINISNLSKPIKQDEDKKDISNIANNNVNIESILTEDKKEDISNVEKILKEGRNNDELGKE